MAKKGSFKKRKLLYDRCYGSCGYCGIEIDIETMHTDHMMPKSLGGSNSIDNLLASCAFCNTSKQTKTLEEYKVYAFVRNYMNGVTFSPKQIEALQSKNLLPSSKEILSEPFFYFELIGIEVNPDPLPGHYQ